MTNVIDNGGSAFPRPHTAADDANWPANHGMSLRDWFAGQALAGWIASLDGDAGIDCEERADHERAVANACYGYADAMLAERGEAK